MQNWETVACPKMGFFIFKILDGDNGFFKFTFYILAQSWHSEHHVKKNPFINYPLMFWDIKKCYFFNFLFAIIEPWTILRSPKMWNFQT